MKPETVVQRITKTSKQQLEEILSLAPATRKERENMVSLIARIVDREHRRVMRRKEAKS